MHSYIAQAIPKCDEQLCMENCTFSNLPDDTQIIRSFDPGMRTQPGEVSPMVGIKKQCAQS